jgi:hypothetical protein
MDSRLVKQLGYVAAGAGIASVVGAAATYLLGLRDHKESRRSIGTFVGLWAPTFFAIAEMLDRVAEQDRHYMGIPIQQKTKGELAEELIERGRSLVRR